MEKPTPQSLSPQLKPKYWQNDKLKFEASLWRRVLWPPPIQICWVHFIGSWTFISFPVSFQVVWNFSHILICFAKKFEFFFNPVIHFIKQYSFFLKKKFRHQKCHLLKWSVIWTPKNTLKLNYYNQVGSTHFSVNLVAKSSNVSFYFSFESFLKFFSSQQP